VNGALQQITTWPVRKKMIVLHLLVLVNFIGGFGLWAMTDQQVWFLIGMIACSTAALVLSSLRCPRCHNFVFRHHVRLGGVQWTYWGGNPLPKRCGACKWDFRVPHTAAHTRPARSS
jgi:hypothetical protein